MDAITYEELLDKLDFMNALYDTVRIVDPVLKVVLTEGKTLSLVKADEDSPETFCHDLWKKGDICFNCIAMRAFNEKESFIKIEYDGETPFVVTALPVQLEDRLVVLELLKTVTDPGMLGDFANAAPPEIRRVLQKRNLELVTDPLTNIFNRRYIQERLPHDILSSNLLRQPMTLVMADIDYFKKVNDTHGHLAGDFILEKFAGLLGRFIRSETDWVARFGGEEFLIILNKTGSDEAYRIVERLREAIEKEDNIYQGKDIKITCSFGMHTFLDEEASLEELIRRADRNLYAAKEAGRNKIVRN